MKENMAKSASQMFLNKNIFQTWRMNKGFSADGVYLIKNRNH